MSNKTLAIIIDDFSDRVFEYDNVTLYDYGNYKHITTFDYVGTKPDGTLGYNDFAPVFNVNLLNDFFRINGNNIQTNDFLSEQQFLDGNYINQADLLINYFGANYGFNDVEADGDDIINSPGVMTIIDNKNSAIERVKASGIGISSETIYVKTIEKHHLAIRDSL